MDEEFKKRLSDYFTSTELVDLLDVPTDILIDLLEEYIDERKTEIEDFLNYGS
jgi:hypothetical protein